MVSKATIKYWLDWFEFLAEDRLSPPQYDEAMRVLTLAEQHAALIGQREKLVTACRDLLEVLPTSSDMRRLYDAAAIPMPYYHSEYVERVDRVLVAIAATGQEEVGV